MAQHRTRCHGRTNFRIEGFLAIPVFSTPLPAPAAFSKPVNGGVTWQAIFERPETISIGDIAIDPKHPDTVWVGTGEANVRNSVSIGGGMYYTNDGGKTWEHRGLEQTMTISRVALDPRDSNRVFVAAVGHPFGPNTERGVFFSPDSGRTWQKVLYTTVKMELRSRYRSIQPGYRLRRHVAVRPQAMALR